MERTTPGVFTVFALAVASIMSVSVSHADDVHLFIPPDGAWHTAISLAPGDEITVSAGGLVCYYIPGGTDPTGTVYYGCHDADGCNPDCAVPCLNGKDPDSLVCRHTAGPGNMVPTTWWWALVGRIGANRFFCGKCWRYTAGDACTLELAANIAFPELWVGGFDVTIRYGNWPSVSGPATWGGVKSLYR